jgi:hypothetical protein
MSFQETIRDTFDLSGVPRQAYYIGLAGVMPYLATSLATVVCAREINTAAEQGTGWLFEGQTATLLLQVLEPLQIGYGAVVRPASVLSMPSTLSLETLRPMLTSSRSYPASAPSTGVSNGPATAATTATPAT